MNTPICDFVDKYVKADPVRFHMPGHKGKTFTGAEEKDITEINGADVLSLPVGIIAGSEENAARLFGAKKTLYSTEGCTLAIKQMLYLAVMHAKATNRTPYILAARNAHKAFVSAACEIGFDFSFIPSGSFIENDLTPETLERAIALSPVPPTSVYVTSPDYLGNLLDIRSLKAVCEKHGALLLTDNAHGAYLRFLPEDIHPLSCGADMCSDSAHKTLSALTGAAYLHISNAVYRVIDGFIENARSLFSSTSPSWLTLFSLDKLNAYLSDGYRGRLHKFIRIADAAKTELKDLGYTLSGSEPLKITVFSKSFGYTGTKLCEIIRKANIEPEFCDQDLIVFMLTPENDENELKRLTAALDVPRRAALSSRPPLPKKQVRALSPREAIFSLCETVALKDAKNRIFSSCALACPPAVPIVIAGEVIDENALNALSYYGVKTVNAVK